MHTTAEHHGHQGHHGHEGHAMPTSGRALDRVALSATLHCLTGCAIGEVLGMLIGTALGWSDWPTIGLAVVLAFLFGYGLTSLPLLRSGLALAAVVPIALASDTLSIGVMEVVDNGIMLAIPGAMEAGVGTLLFWGSLSVALVVAGAVAFPLNRWLITRGKGHAVVHETGIHGGPPVRLVGVVAVAAAVFGTAVLVNEAANGDGGGHGGMAEAATVRGLAVSADGLRLEPGTRALPLGVRRGFELRILDERGAVVRDFEVEHERRMHLIVARRDLTGFQHLHPTLGSDGTWRTAIALPEAGSYRVFADFKRRGTNYTLASDLLVDGAVRWRQLPRDGAVASAGGDYTVELSSRPARAGHEVELRFVVRHEGAPLDVERYLGAGGHLVALRQDDLAFLHVHPLESGHGHGGQDPVAFATTFPSAGRYRLFLQFKHGGAVRTAAFTRTVGNP